MDNGINKDKIRVHYDAEQDIFYLLFTEKAQKALAEETDDEVFVRFDQDTRKVISVEFLNFQKRITNVFGKEMKYLGSEQPERLFLPKLQGNTSAWGRGQNPPQVHNQGAQTLRHRYDRHQNSKKVREDRRGTGPHYGYGYPFRRQRKEPAK